MEIRLERLETMRVAHVHVLSETPEEDAWEKMVAWAKPRGLLEYGSGTRVFGRNTYPTDAPEPHGYEFFLTLVTDIEAEGEIDIQEIEGGLYAVLRFEDIEKIRDAWGQLWNWIKESEHEHIGWRNGEHGWYDGFEEHLNPLEKSQHKWIFDLWVQLKEKNYDADHRS